MTLGGVHEGSVQLNKTNCSLTRNVSIFIFNCMLYCREGRDDMF